MKSSYNIIMSNLNIMFSREFEFIVEIWLIKRFSKRYNWKYVIVTSVGVDGKFGFPFGEVIGKKVLQEYI